MRLVNVLVVGEVGDGKSTLINALRNKEVSETAAAGLSPKGVTKHVIIYPGPETRGMQFNLIDTPGIGDHDVRPIHFLTMLEAFLMSGAVPGGIQGVVVTLPILRSRIQLGARIVQTIARLGFVAPAGVDKYGGMILVGTKADQAEPDDHRAFMEGYGAESVRAAFWRGAGAPAGGRTVMVCKTDYSQLLEALCQLPVAGIEYHRPAPRDLAEALAAQLGLEVEDLMSELEQSRQIVDENKAEMRRLIEEQQRAREEAREKHQQAQQWLEHYQKDQERIKDKHARENHRRQQQLERMRNDRAQAWQEDDAQRMVRDAQRAVNWLLEQGMDALLNCEEPLSRGSHEEQLAGVRSCIRGCVKNFADADKEAQQSSSEIRVLLERQVARRGQLEDEKREMETLVQECGRSIEAKAKREDDVGKEIQRLENEAREQRDLCRKAEDDAEAARKKRRDMVIGGSIAMAVPIFGWIAGGTTVAVAETAVKSAEAAARAQVEVAKISENFALFAAEQERLSMAVVQSQHSEAQRQLLQLHDHISQASDQVAHLQHQIGFAQRATEKISDLWRTTKDVLSCGQAAHLVAEQKAFRLILLREPLFAIAATEGYQQLQQHDLLTQKDGAPSGIERLTEQLALHCPGMRVDVSDLI